jgi:trehalose-6-phosphate synthase
MEAMHQALTMPLVERKARFERLFDKVTRTTANTYCKDFLAALTRPVPVLASGETTGGIDAAGATLQ